MIIGVAALNQPTNLSRLSILVLMIEGSIKGSFCSPEVANERREKGGFTVKKPFPDSGNGFFIFGV
jgi:hypothetical protein